MGMMKKAASGVRAILPTFGLTDLALFAPFALTYPSTHSGQAQCTLRASKMVQPCLWKGVSWHAWVGRVRQRTFLNILPPDDAGLI